MNLHTAELIEDIVSTHDFLSELPSPSENKLPKTQKKHNFKMPLKYELNFGISARIQQNFNFKELMDKINRECRFNKMFTENMHKDKVMLTHLNQHRKDFNFQKLKINTIRVVDKLFDRFLKINIEAQTK